MYWPGKPKMVNINYNDNDSHEKVTIIKNNYFSNKQRFYYFKVIGIYWGNDSLSYYSKRDPENLSEFFK